MILAGYALFYEKRDLAKVSHDLRHHRSLWKEAIDIDIPRIELQAVITAGFMRDLAGITERTYSCIKEIQKHLEAILREKKNRFKFWKFIHPEHVKVLRYSEMSQGICSISKSFETPILGVISSVADYLPMG